MPTIGYYTLNFQRSGSIPTTWTDLHLTTNPADGVIRKSLYIQQLNSFIALSTVGNGIKLRVLRSDDAGVTWVNNYETPASLLTPANFDNKSAYVVLSCGSSPTTWFKVQIASLDSASLASGAVLNGLAKYEF